MLIRRCAQLEATTPRDATSAAVCTLRLLARRILDADRRTEGKPRRKTIRCLKRYIAREIYQIITSPPEAEPSAA